MASIRRTIVGPVLAGVALGQPAVAGKPPRPAASVAADDARVNAGMEKARKTVDRFIVAIRDPKPGQAHFMFKLALVQDDFTRRAGQSRPPLAAPDGPSQSGALCLLHPAAVADHVLPGSRDRAEVAVGADGEVPV